MRAPCDLLALVLLWALVSTATVDAEPLSPERMQFGNGLVVVLVEDPEAPWVEVRAVLLPRGDELTPLDRVAPDAWARSGAGARTPRDVEAALASSDADLRSLASDADLGAAVLRGLALRAPRDAWIPPFRILSDLLQSPAFDPDEAAKVSRRREALRARSTRALLDDAFRELLGVAAPVGLTATDLARWHARRVGPRDLVLGFAGGFERRQLLPLVHETLGGWTADGDGGSPPPTSAPTAGVHFAPWEGATEAFLRLGHRQPADAADAAARAVLFEILRSRLPEEAVLADDDPLEVVVRSSPDAASDLLETVTAELEGLRREPPTEVELETALAAIDPPEARGASELLDVMLSREAWGGDPSGGGSLTTERVRAAAARAVRPADLSVLVAGPPAVRRAGLAGRGRIGVLDLDLPPPAAARLDGDGTGQGSAESGLGRARELVARALETHGGERIATLRSFDTHLHALVATPRGDLEAELRRVVVFPDYFRQELALPRGRIVQVLEGDRGTVVTPRGRQRMPALQQAALEDDLLEELVVLLERIGPEDVVGTRGSGEAAGWPVERVEILVGAESVVLGLDPADGRVRSLSHGGTDMIDRHGEVEVVYSDFRRVDEILLPFEATRTLDGEPFVGLRRLVADHVRLDAASREAAVPTGPRDDEPASETTAGDETEDETGAGSAAGTAAAPGDGASSSPGS